MAEVNREALEKRRDELKAELDQAIANVQALNGAIQDCNYWLARIEEDDAGD